MNMIADMGNAPSPVSKDVDEASSGGIEIDLVSIWAALYRNRILLAATIVVFLGLGAVYLLLATPIYEATATVQVEEQAAPVLETQALDPTRPSPDADRFLKTQMDILESRSLAMSVAQDLRLIGNPAFLAAMGASSDIRPKGALTLRDAQREAVLSILKDNLTVELPVDSRIVQIKFASQDPVLSARIANSYADNFIRSNLQRKYDTSAYAREFLTKQLDEARRQLERSERDALAYAKRARLIDASNSADDSKGTRSLTIARLVSVNSAYSDAVARRIAAQEKWNLAARSSILDLPEVLSNPAIQALLGKRAEAEAEYQYQRQTRRDDFPTLRQAKAQIDELNRQINAIGLDIRQSLRSQLNAALREEEELKVNLGGLETDTLAEQNRSVQMSILRRSADTNRSLYDSLLSRFRQLSAEAGIQANNILVIDRAETPAGPTWPKIWVVLLLAFIAGIAVAVMLTLVREHLDDTIRSSEELQYKLGLPMLGAVPIAPNTSDVATELNDSKSAISEAFNSIRAALLLSSREGIPKTILFTSTQPSEGKTTTVYAVGSGLAKIGKSVVIVDLDLRRPSQARMFDLPNKRGASDALALADNIDDVIQKTKIPGVSLVSSGPIPPNPTELLSSPSLGRMLDQLAAMFDVVIVDAPPILGLADAVLLGSAVQGAVLVVESGRTYRGGSKAAVARMQKAGTRFIGAILTKQASRQLGYSYDYAFHYSYGEDSRSGV